MNEGVQHGNEGGSGDGAGTGTETGGWRPVDEHRRMETGTGAGTETRAVAEMGTGTRMGTGTGNGNEDRAEERRRRARNCIRFVETMWETGETYVERGGNVDNERLVQ